MRKQFIEGGAQAEAEALCPWAAEIIPTVGGWLCFESMQDVHMWLSQA